MHSRRTDLPRRCRPGRRPVCERQQPRRLGRVVVVVPNLKAEFSLVRHRVGDSVAVVACCVVAAREVAEDAPGPQTLERHQRGPPRGLPMGDPLQHPPPALPPRPDQPHHPRTAINYADRRRMTTGVHHQRQRGRPSRSVPRLDRGRSLCPTKRLAVRVARSDRTCYLPSDHTFTHAMYEWGAYAGEDGRGARR